MRENLGNDNWAEVVSVDGTVNVLGTVSVDAIEIAPGGSQFLAPAQISTVANVTTQLIAANATRVTVMISSLSTNTANITLTVSGGAITDGYLLEPGDTVPVPTTAAIFYRTTAAAQVLSLFEVRV